MLQRYEIFVHPKRTNKLFFIHYKKNAGRHTQKRQLGASIKTDRRRSRTLQYTTKMGAPLPLRPSVRLVVCKGMKHLFIQSEQKELFFFQVIVEPPKLFLRTNLRGISAEDMSLYWHHPHDIFFSCHLCLWLSHSYYHRAPPCQIHYVFHPKKESY